MTPEEIKLVIKEAFAEHHNCTAFTEEERGLIRDLVSGARNLKSAIIWAIVVLIIASLGVKYLPPFKG